MHCTYSSVRLIAIILLYKLLLVTLFQRVTSTTIITDKTRLPFTDL